MKKTKTNTTATADEKFGEWHFDILENKKRLIGATLKNMTKLIPIYS